MRRNLIVLLISSWALPILLFAQTTYKMGVDELFEKGIKNSTLIHQSIVKTQIQDDRVGLAKNLRLPDIKGNVDFGYLGKPLVLNKNLSYFSGVPTMPNTQDAYSFSADEPIYEFGRIKNTINKAELEREVSRLSLDNDKSKLKLWLMNKYLLLFNLYKQKEVYTNNVAEATKRLADIITMHEQGLITDNDVLRSRVVLTNYKLDLKDTDDNINIVSQQLDIVLGMDETLIIQPDTTVLAMKPKLKTELDYVAMAYENYPEMQMMKKNVELAQNNLKLKRADYLPKLTLHAGYDLGRPILLAVPEPLNKYLSGWNVTLNLSYRFSSLFDKKHSMGQARRQILLSKLGEDEKKEGIRRDVRAAYLKHYEAEDRIEQLTQSVIQARENYRIVKNKYFNQLAILTDLLDADTMELNAELQLTAAKANAIYTYYQLQEISGGL